MTLPADGLLHTRLRRTARILVWLVIIIAASVLSGWFFNIDGLKRPLTGGLVAMNPVSAVCFILAASSFLLLANSKRTRSEFSTGYLFAMLVMLTGILVILHSANITGFAIDKLLFPAQIQADKEGVSGNFSNDMALNTAICFVLTGAALLLIHRESIKEKIPSQFIAVLVGLIGFLSVLLYLYRVEDFYGLLIHIPMAIHSGFCFFLLCLAILFVHADKGLMKEFTSRYTGGIMARILVPAAILIPVALGFLRLLASWRGHISTELGVTLLVLSIIIVFLAFIRYSIMVLNNKDRLREKAEASLQKSKERMQELFDSSPDAAVIVNEEGIIQMVNDQAEKLFGYSKKELTGETVELLVPGPLKQPHRQHRRHYMNNPHTRMMGAGLELVAVKKNGQQFPVEISLSPLHTDKGIVISASIRDVTERKKMEQQLKRFNEELEKQVEIKTAEIKANEEKFRILIERISDGFLALDKNWHYTYANKKIGELTHRDPKSLIGKKVWEEFPDAVGSDTYKAFLRAMDEQQYVTNTDYHPPLELWQENHIYPSPDGLSVFVRDITIKKKAEQEMQKANEELHRLSSYLQSVREEERVHIAREIHDELGQQLTGLKMYVHSLQKGLNDPLEDNSGRIKDIIELTDEIVRSVRRISSNLRPAILDDLGLAPALEWQAREVEKRSSIKVEFETELFFLDLPMNISTGFFRIYQEALNNAVKHANASTIRSRLALKDDRLILEIEDDGKGISAGDDKSPKTFGLLGIRERVHMMKGKFEMNSEPGKGTRLYIAVPLQQFIN